MTDSNDKGCQCEWLEERTCNEPFYKEFNGIPYCVLHFPDVGKKEDFQIAFERRLDPDNENYLNFVGLWFPDLVSFRLESFSFIADFSAVRFTAGAKFSDCEFLQARFVNAHFGGIADFARAQFEGIADFSGARFQKKVTFRRAIFSNEGRFFRTHFEGLADFGGVQIEGEASFHQAVFDHAYFGLARIPVPESKAKATDSSQFESYRSKFASAYFGGATFVRCDFNQACFAQSVSFFSAQSKEFSDFSSVDFNKADFSNSQLAQANFDGSFFLTAPKFSQCQMYGNTNFATARMPGADFSEVVFHGHADFTVTRFENSLAEWEKERLKECDIAFDKVLSPIVITFERATFKDGVTFKGNELYQDKGILIFDDALFEMPDRVRFISVSMPPHSFMNVDPRKFHLIDTRWGFIDRRTALKEAKAALQRFERSPSGLGLAYRQLAVNAEENNRYPQAADLRFLAMEVARKPWRRIDWLSLSWWYGLLSGYGEKVRRAFAALVIIWFLFALIYWGLGNELWWQPKQAALSVSTSSDRQPPSPIRLTPGEALLYSANVMALQKPEPMPANKRAKFFVLFETILGPLQGALLALAIRRKFMR
jgi:uncharacterized protein YjbI with pentapeptide repeats